MSTRTRSTRTASHRSALAVEALEGRRLLSASASGVATVTDGELTVVGTRRDDQIMVMVMPNELGVEMLDVSLNGNALGSFPLAEVTRIVVQAGRGNDFVMAQTGLPLTAFGDAGNDTLLGGWGDDWLYGGRGNDTAYGSDGNDRLFGEGGDDLLSGDFGDDLLDGGGGIDSLYGYAGRDTLSGGACDDVLDGGEDDDVLEGNRGADQVTGGGGADRFSKRDAASEILDLTEEDRVA